VNDIADKVSTLLEQLPEPQAKVLRQLREDTLKMVPAAHDRISYQMPTLEISGQILLHYSGFKNHNSLFCGAELPRRLADVLGERLASKGTIQFGIDEVFPRALLKKILTERIRIINEQFPKKSGEYLSFYDNGRLKSRGKYKDGLMHGQWEFYRRDGSLMRSGKLQAGEPVGEWKTFVRPEAE
jgi:uncharacterized protein YdhG (YjbR/CyaY superfamily)